MKRQFLSLCVLLLLVMMSSCGKIEGDEIFVPLAEEPLQPWSLTKARDWHAAQPWIVGCNFFPSTAINQIEMWQSSTYDRETIDRELGWAAELGFNTVRVFLHSFVWEKERDSFINNMEDFLTIADSYDIKTMFCFFSGAGDYLSHCTLGKQLDPIPGVHNLAFMGDPTVTNDDGKAMPKRYDLMKRYVQDVVAHFRTDERIRIWEAWNEPGTAANREDITTELLPKSIQWIREMNPEQPITVGIHSPDMEHAVFDEIALTMSEINSYHNYSGWNDAKNTYGGTIIGMKHIALEILAYGRPVICSEYLARGNDWQSTFQNTMPFMKQYKIGAINWGLVWGKTNTVYPWGWDKGDVEPDPWFHDILLPDGSPKYPEEKEFLREITGITELNK